jgi:uroporphyrinogen decarboxylase
MTSRDRVRAALCHQPVDRVPCDLNVTMTAYEKLKRHLGIRVDDRPKPNTAMEVVPHPEILAALGVDSISVKLGGRPAVTGPLPSAFRDAWGIEHRLVAQQAGQYYEAIRHPLAQASRRDLASHPWPDARSGREADLLGQDAEELYGGTELALVGRFGAPILETAAGLLGMEEWYARLMIDRDFVRELLDRIERICTAQDLAGLEASGARLSIMKVSGEDLGMQQALLYPPEIFHEILLPVLRHRWEAVQQRIAARGWEAKVMLHSCGAIRSVIPELIASGIELLDPVQPLAAGMDAGTLHRQFGGKLVFHGGIDVQRLLPTGSPEEVQRETCRVLEAFDALRGGFIAAPSHTVQADVPPQNIEAMTEAVKSWGSGGTAPRRSG